MGYGEKGEGVARKEEGDKRNGMVPIGGWNRKLTKY